MILASVGIERSAAFVERFFDSIGQSLHFCDVRVTSAFHPIAAKSRTFRHFGFGPIPDVSNRSKIVRYSITLSASTSSVDGIEIPIVRAVVAFIANSNLVGCSTGISLGLVPCRILSTNSAARRY